MNIVHILIKEFIQITRDKMMFRIIFIAPVVQLLLFGYAITTDIKNLSIAVCDHDNSRRSREFVESFAHTGYFKITQFVESQKQIESLLDEGKVKIGVYIPANFSRKLNRRETASVQVLIDGTNPNTGRIALGYISRIIRQNSRKIAWEREQIGVNNSLRIWYNQDLRSANYMVPGVICLILLVITMILTSLSLAKEKEKKTIEQLMVTPIKPYQLVLGKLIPFAIIGIIDMVLIMLVGIFWFKIPIKGSVFLLTGSAGLFLMTTLGLGILISAVSKTQHQALMLAWAIMIPNVLLSGFLFPIDNMPQIIQYITYFTPLRYFLVIIRGIFLKGVGFSILWEEVFSLMLFGIMVIGMSILTVKKRV